MLQPMQLNDLLVRFRVLRLACPCRSS